MESNKTTEPTSKNVRKRTVAIGFFALGILATIAVVTIKSKLETKSEDVISLGSPDDVNFYDINRLKGFQNIQPVVTVEPQKESLKMMPLKNEIEQLIDSLKTAGFVSDVSVYFKNFKRGDWLVVNDKAVFHPASLMKVPLMLAVLKKAEATPGLLEKKIVYKKKPEKVMYEQHFQGPSISEGKSYSIHELIFYCVANSDNHATHALETNVDLSGVSGMFEDIGLPKPNMTDGNYEIGARSYSRFMETIFNSSFLSPEYSEYGAEMLANCNFKEGFSKGMPKDVRMWHKFGEWTRPGENAVELHESGALFMNGKVYLLTVMTRGKNLDELATVLQKISDLIARKTVKIPFSIARATLHARNATC